MLRCYQFPYEERQGYAKQLYLALSTFFLILAFIPITKAQEFTHWHLPEGKKERLGKGWVGQVIPILIDCLTLT